jgi:small subunit ribosomal protein S1
VKAVTENTSSNSSTNAPAATLGDNDVLAALKAKMEKQKK